MWTTCSNSSLRCRDIWECRSPTNTRVVMARAHKRNDSAIRTNHSSLICIHNLFYLQICLGKTKIKLQQYSTKKATITYIIHIFLAFHLFFLNFQFNFCIFTIVYLCFIVFIVQFYRYLSGVCGMNEKSLHPSSLIFFLLPSYLFFLFFSH